MAKVKNKKIHFTICFFFVLEVPRLYWYNTYHARSKGEIISFQSSWPTWYCKKRSEISFEFSIDQKKIVNTSPRKSLYQTCLMCLLTYQLGSFKIKKLKQIERNIFFTNIATHLMLKIDTETSVFIMHRSTLYSIALKCKTRAASTLWDRGIPAVLEKKIPQFSYKVAGLIPHFQKESCTFFRSSAGF